MEVVNERPRTAGSRHAIRVAPWTWKLGPAPHTRDIPHAGNELGNGKRAERAGGGGLGRFTAASAGLTLPSPGSSFCMEVCM